MGRIGYVVGDVEMMVVGEVVGVWVVSVGEKEDDVEWRVILMKRVYGGDEDRVGG